MDAGAVATLDVGIGVHDGIVTNTKNPQGTKKTDLDIKRIYLFPLDVLRLPTANTKPSAIML